jgi:hypothetical protein
LFNFQNILKYGFCNLSIVPCRLEPNDRAEMTTEVLFGDSYKVIEERAKWVRIRNSFDKYEGWIDRKQFFEISENVYKDIEKTGHQNLVLDLAAVVKVNESQLQSILIGSSLPNINEENKFEIESLTFHFDGSFINVSEKQSKSKLIENSFMYLNAPYLWGGKTPFGIDCSGFTQMVYKLNGYKLPRDAYQQAEIGTTLSFVEEAEAGDLAFFDNEEGSITHVGMLLDDGKIIHASGKVRIDPIDHHGIYNIENKTYSHKLRLIKKVIK